MCDNEQPPAKKHKKDDVVVRMRTSEGVKLKSLFERLSSLVDCCLEFRADGIYTSAIEVQMVYLSLSLNNVTDYVCKRPLVCGIQTNVWWKKLKNISQDQTVEILITEEDIEKAQIQLSFIQNNNRSVVRYSLNQINIDYERIDIPDKDFKSVLSIPAMQFQKALRCCGDDANIVRISSDIVEIEVDEVDEVEEDGDRDGDRNGDREDEDDEDEGHEVHPGDPQEDSDDDGEEKEEVVTATPPLAVKKSKKKEHKTDVATHKKKINVPRLLIEAHDSTGCGVEPSVGISMIIDGCMDKDGKRIDFDKDIIGRIFDGFRNSLIFF
jgi:proliferating cell nuclear antigen